MKLQPNLGAQKWLPEALNSFSSFLDGLASSLKRSIDSLFFKWLSLRKSSSVPCEYSKRNVCLGAAPYNIPIYIYPFMTNYKIKNPILFIINTFESIIYHKQSEVMLAERKKVFKSIKCPKATSFFRNSKVTIIFNSQL